MTDMYIGELAKRTNTTPKAIRHYEKIGLLPVAQRKGKYRIYQEIDIYAVQMIRLAQSVGFGLKELQEISHLKYALKSFPMEKAQTLIRFKYQQIEAQKKELDQMLINLDLLEQRLQSQYA